MQADWLFSLLQYPRCVRACIKLRALVVNLAAPASGSVSLSEIVENSQSSVLWYFFSLNPTGSFQYRDATLIRKLPDLYKSLTAHNVVKERCTW